MRSLSNIEDLRTSLSDLSVDRSLHSSDGEFSAPCRDQRDLLRARLVVGEGVERRWIRGARQRCSASGLNPSIPIPPLETRLEL